MQKNEGKMVMTGSNDATMRMTPQGTKALSTKEIEGE